MNRRGFLHAMLAAGAAPAVVKAANIMPIFVRRDSGLLIAESITATEIGNRLITFEEITREALRLMHKNMQFVQKVNLDYANVGERLVIRKPSALRLA